MEGGIRIRLKLVLGESECDGNDEEIYRSICF